MSELPGYLRRFKYPRPVLTPTKVGGDFDSLQVDCAGIIERSGRYYMTYAGWDGECTRIGLAQSKDLLHWKRVKMILGLGPEGAWDSGSVSGPFVLQHQRKYFLFYCGFPTLGYEAGPGAIGIATSTDLSNWKRHPENPILTHSPGGAWEKGGVYKPFVKRHRSLFYNAKDNPRWPWHERIGLAMSTSLSCWDKHPDNPLLDVGEEGAWDCQFVADPWISMINGVWHMFYYGFDGVHAQEGVAMSSDLMHWRKSEFNPIVRVGPPSSFDSKHSHKPCIIKRGNVYYHFYTAVDGDRSIALATSSPLDF